MEFQKKKLDASFFQTENKNEPVREWLKELPKADKKITQNRIRFSKKKKKSIYA